MSSVTDLFPMLHYNIKAAIVKPPTLQEENPNHEIRSLESMTNDEIPMTKQMVSCRKQHASALGLDIRH
jgi:hypothetical protein